MDGRDWPADDLGRASRLRRIANAAVLALIRAVWGLRVAGLEHVPARGPVILAANHVSNLDGPVLSVGASSVRCVRALAKVELFRVPVLGWFLRRMGTIPIDRRAGDVRALRAALEVLEAGGCLGVMPEGTRSKTGVPGRAKAGLGFLASVSQAAVVPARIVNTERCWRLRPLEVRFGPAMRFQGPAGDRQACRKFAQDVLDRVFTL